MVRARRHLRQRKAFACDDPERSLDFTWRGIPGRFAIAALAGGNAKSESRTFRTDWLQRFWKRGGERARFDQQPVEAYATISACLEAFALTHDEYWKRASRRCFEWFLGRNDLGESLYDSSTGGCRDALHQDRVSQNQGAESSLAFYLSLAEMTQAETAPDLKIPSHKIG